MSALTISFNPLLVPFDNGANVFVIVFQLAIRFAVCVPFNKSVTVVKSPPMYNKFLVVSKTLVNTFPFVIKLPYFDKLILPEILLLVL